MTYRAAEIRVRPTGRWRFEAHIILRDDGLTVDGEEQLFEGVELERGPFVGRTHRGAWRKAYRAAGGRLWDVAPRA